MYAVLIIPRAQRDLDALSAERFRPIHAAILGLEKEPRGHQTVKLTKEGGYRLRVGGWAGCPIPYKFLGGDRIPDGL